MPTNQRELRAAFWRDNPDASRRLITSYDGKGRMYCTDTRVAWVDYVDMMQRSGEISQVLAERATLQPARYGFEFEIQQHTGRYGWEHVNTETTRADARRSLREYRENQPGTYRLQRRRIILQAVE